MFQQHGEPPRLTRHMCLCGMHGPPPEMNPAPGACALRLASPVTRRMSAEQKRRLRVPIWSALKHYGMTLANWLRQRLRPSITHRVPAGDNTRSLPKARHCLNPSNGRYKRPLAGRPNLVRRKSPSVAKPHPMEAGSTATRPSILLPGRWTYRA